MSVDLNTSKEININTMYDRHANVMKYNNTFYQINLNSRYVLSKNETFII